MTIKARNSLKLFFCIIYTAVLGLNFFHFFYQIAHGTFILPEVFFKEEPNTNVFFGYNPNIVIASIFTIGIFVAGLSFIILRAFANTQSTILNFFSIFLFACFCDTFRFYIVFFHVAGTCSQLLFILGNMALFARLLAPLSLSVVVFMSFDEQPQNLTRNFLLLMLSTLFMTFAIPLNTTKILPILTVGYTFRTTINIISILLAILNVVSLFFYNNSNKYPQKTTLGFALLSGGYLLLFNCTTMFMLITGTAFFGAGTFIYLYQLHTDFLWK